MVDQIDKSWPVIPNASLNTNDLFRVYGPNNPDLVYTPATGIANNSNRNYQSIAEFLATAIPADVNSAQILNYATPGDLGSESMLFVRGAALTATNLALWSRDFTQAAWVKTNVTATKNQTDYNGNANACSLLTATAPNATVYQSITSASAARLFHLYIKPVTVTGAIYLTVDGVAFLNITPGGLALNTAGWERYSAIQQTLANPTFGIKFANSGDSIIVDHAMMETPQATDVSSPEIDTTTVAVTRLQPWCVQSADGAYWRLSNHKVLPQMFGAKADGTTNDSFALQTAIDLALLMNSETNWGGLTSQGMVSVFLQNKTFKCNTTLRIYALASSIKIHGNGNYISNQSAGPAIFFPVNTTYIDNPACSHMILHVEGISLQSTGSLGSGSSFGIRHQNVASIKNVYICNTTLDGIFGDCSTTYYQSPNLDGSFYENLQFNSTGRHGIHLLGADANVCRGQNLVFNACGGSCIRDFGFYGSRWTNILTEGNGSKAFQLRPGIEGGVCLGSDGNQYQVVLGQEAGASTTDPTTDTTSIFWAPCFWKQGATTFQALGGSAAAALPTWTSGLTWVSSPVIAANNGTTEVNGLYLEVGYSPPPMGSFLLISAIDPIQYYGPNTVAHLDAAGITITNGIGGFRSENNCNPRSASTYTWKAYLGRATLNNETANIVGSDCSVTGQFFQQYWDTTNKIVSFGYALDSAPFSLLPTDTALQFGRGAGVGAATWMPNGTILGDTTNGRLVTQATAAPGSGARAVGDWTFNRNPSAGSPIAWRCVSAGSPGTWETLYASTVPFLGVMAFGSLPAANTVLNGTTAIITDCNSTTLGAIAAAGGANRVRVNSDTANWIIG